MFIHDVSVLLVSRRHKLLSQDLRAGLCGLFAAWSGRYGLGTSDRGYQFSLSLNVVCCLI